MLAINFHSTFSQPVRELQELSPSPFYDEDTETEMCDGRVSKQHH